VTASVEREFVPMSGDGAASLQRMRGFADSDGHIACSGATGDQEMNYSDSVNNGHRRKVVIDGVFNRCLENSMFIVSASEMQMLCCY